MTNPYLLYQLAVDRRRELIAQADAFRLVETPYEAHPRSHIDSFSMVPDPDSDATAAVLGTLRTDRRDPNG